MKTVNEIAQLAHISVRTLHHYDAIGLLKPTQITEAGYRLYDDAALGRLQTILLFRELQFPLKEIREMLTAEDFDPIAALDDQIRLLQLRREHLDRLIEHARTIQKTGVMTMSYKAYDKKKRDSYAAEAKARWGHTEAWKQSQGKTPDKNRMEEIFRGFADLRDKEPGDPAVQAQVACWQQFITEEMYPCTREILAGLGQMYVCDERFKKNIDKCGEGTAEFAAEGIRIYVENK